MARPRKPVRRRRAERAAQYKTAEYRELTRRLAANVLATREAHGLTQERAAEACEMPVRLFQFIEAGETNATFTTLARLAKGLRVDAAQLLSPVTR